MGSAVGGEDATGSRQTARRRPPGRPRREIDLEAVADAAAKLFAQGGYEAVSIEATAEMLSVSRATLYRTVPTKDHLLGILFERATQDLHQSALELLDRTADPGEQLFGLVRLQIAAAVAMRRYLMVFFGGIGLPDDVVDRWRQWSRAYEEVWVGAVNQAMSAGVLEPSEDPVLTTRLLLGMCIWVSRWYRPAEKYSDEDITNAAVQLIAQYTRRT
ncbi:TetR/AcrR family transcriptional regulator [Nocardia terrae]|uniref:TetR/AcrR family transcriptional regulator n=1 Tax=Nocardia terrae TaxID=2675851 RepID=UPI002E2662C9